MIGRKLRLFSIILMRSEQQQKQIKKYTARDSGNQEKQIDNCWWDIVAC